jgi:hypothetical protein
VPTKHSTPKPRRSATPVADLLATLPKSAPRGHVTPKGRAIAKRPPAEEPVSGELLPPLLSKRELRPMILQTRRHARAALRANQLLAASLRQLQDAGAHRTYGRKSFPEWAVAEFGELDLTEDSVKNMCRSGRALLLLHEEGRIDLADPRTFPGTTGARALSSVLSNHGDRAAIEVFDACPEGHVVATTVGAAASALLPPPPATTAPAAGGQSSFEDDYEDEPEEIPKLVQDLRDYIERLRDYLDDLAIADDADPIVIVRQYEHFVSDAQALRPVLDAVLPVEGDQ